MKPAKLFFTQTALPTVLVLAAYTLVLAPTGRAAEKPAIDTTDAALQSAAALQIGHRPSFPYRAWYSGSYNKHPDWYANATMFAGSGGDPQAQQRQGIANLMWVYGTQISWKAGADYWIEHAGLNRRTLKADAKRAQPFLLSGIAVDEWEGGTAEKQQWIVDGLRIAKQQNPELFVALWTTGINEKIVAMTREGTVDLVLVEAYNITKKRGLGVGWATGLERMDRAQKAGIENKTVFSFGHITSDANWKEGTVWNETLIRQRMSELKARYPQMPGIAFFEAGAEDAQAQDKIVRLFDRLSAEYWPDTLALNGTFALTPQNATKTRLRLHGSNAKAKTRVTIGESKLATIKPADANSDLTKTEITRPVRAQLWNFKPLGADIYQIHASDDATLLLTAEANGVALQKADNSAAQKWQLRKVHNGYTIAPASTSGQRLEATGATIVQLAPANGSTAQVWALTPEYLSPDLKGEN